MASPRWFDADEAARRTAAAYDRSYSRGPAASDGGDPHVGSRAPLRQLEVPTLVIHGRPTR